MTTATEATLAREAGICYAAIAMSTDYDCWKENEESVTVEQILKVMKMNAENVTKLLICAIPRIKYFNDNYPDCGCKDAINSAIL